jgi:hypothetical protein
MENALLARENDIATAIIGLKKKSHILEDRLLALELLIRQIKDQAIGIQYTRCDDSYVWVPDGCLVP